MKEDAIRTHDRILVASCNSQHHEQVLWEAMISRNASAFIWGGDAVYADSYRKWATPETFKELYEFQKQHPGYRKFLDSQIHTFGVLDDHDYGTNNGDVSYPYRQESGVSFACNFLELEGDAICDRAKRGLGVYGVKVLDFGKPRGQELLSDQEARLDPDVVVNDDLPLLSNKSVAIFMLDIRSNKTPYKKKSVYPINDIGDFLGEKQWQWFETALKRSTATVTIIVEGLQLHATRFGPVENWSRFPASQHRMYQALLQTHIKSPIIVSGDVHHAQLLQKHCQFLNKYQKTMKGLPSRRLLEVTTSGMTHSWGSETCARPHQLIFCRLTHAKWAAKIAMQLAQVINGAFVWKELIDLSKPDMASHGTGEGRSGMQYSLERNFAEFEFDWSNQTVTIRVLGMELAAKPLLSTTWTFDSLSGSISKANSPHTELPDEQFVVTYTQLENFGAFSNTTNGGQWICLNYRGSTNIILIIAGALIPVMVAISITFLPCLIPLFLWKRFSRRLTKTKQS